MILQALVDYYNRAALNPDEDIPRYGFSEESIEFSLTIARDGKVLDFTDQCRVDGKKRLPRRMNVPKNRGRQSGILPFFLWDKTSYALGVSAEEDRTAREHEAFVELHRTILSQLEDDGAIAFLLFLQKWTVRDFALVAIPEIMIDKNVVFRLDGDRRFLHERELLIKAWEGYISSSAGVEGRCLVTGEQGPIAKVHPSIRGVGEKAQTAIVSFNFDSAKSYGKDQSENAPISERAAAAYTSGLNHLLRRDRRRRVQIGDASTVFWAERDAPEADSLMAMMLGASDEAAGTLDTNATAKLHGILDQLAHGRGLEEAAPDFDPGVRYHVLGLSPNAARLSVRFWHTDTLGVLAERFGQHWRDLMIEPNKWKQPPALWRLLVQTAVEGKSEDVPKQLAGEVTRAILTGARYPHALLTSVIVRIRADGDVNGMRAALCKACLVRDARINSKQEDRYLALDLENKDPAYRLGRLFAVLENIQRAALGNEINATIRDKYYAAASATPAAVFPLLIRGSHNHLGNVRKEGDKGRGRAFWFEQRISDILSALESRFPKSFSLEDQGRFTIGYYHERFTRSPKADDTDHSTTAED